MRFGVVLYASCLRESNSSDQNSDASTSGLPIGKRRSFRPTNEYLTEFGIAELERTLKIKQCKTRTKTHTIPVNSYSVWEESGNKKLFSNYDARRQNELQTQTMISTAERLCWYHFWEFDPGSGRTLAACLTHASRTENLRIETSVNWDLFLVADGRVTRE